MQKKKILLVLLWANGDCLYGTTIAKQVKLDYPGCHLTWAIAGFCKGMIKNNPYVDEVLEVNEVPKSNLSAFRKYKKKVLQQKKTGIWEEVFIPQLVDDNFANYDGCIRSAIFRGYPNKITVPVTPVLCITDDEKITVKIFAENNHLSHYKNVLLFEFAPMSNQSGITQEFAINTALEITRKTNSIVILSSGNKLTNLPETLVDGSILSLRETAELTNYCNFLIGSSSGITWISTSEAAKPLPMVQLLNTKSLFLNSVTRDFRRQGINEKQVIELTDRSILNTADCVIAALDNFENARSKYHTEIPVSFLTTRVIIYNLLCYFQFKAIARHIKINRKVYGNNISFYKECVIGFLIFPFKLVLNFFRKKIIRIK